MTSVTRWGTFGPLPPRAPAWMLVPVRWRTRFLRVDGHLPWYECRPDLVRAVLVVLFAVVLVARWYGGSGPHAVSVLYVFPVSLMALVWGLRGGLAGAALAVVGMVIPEVFGDSHLDAFGWATRLSAIVLLGVLLGAAQDRTRANVRLRLDAEADRIRLQRRAAQAAAAAEINDSLVQGMASAKWLLEMGNVEAGTEVLEETIDRAQALVSGLVGREVEPV